ncbi:MAG: FtsX-like permease family protein, partial [Bacteroidota bacterium]
FMEQQDKGMNMENVFIVKAPILKAGNWYEKRKALELFKEECLSLPFVVEATSSSTIASEEYRNETFISFQNGKNKVLVHQNGIDEAFFDLYDVAFLAGSNFIPDARFKNRRSIILNESAARNLGVNDLEKSIGTKILDSESEEIFELVGIVKDFHKTSLKYQMAPTAFKFNDIRGHISLKMKGEGRDALVLGQQINTIQQKWEQAYPDAAFNAFFLDQQYAAQDAEDRSFGILFKYFTVLSIVISCLGLFSLSLFISIKRQKEIGVRKVFGATVGDILLTFYKSYLMPLFISIIIGAPLAYYLMNQWLQNFAYRTAIGFQTIGLALLSLAVVFLLTVSYHIIRSSLAEPVNVLKGD